MYLKMCAPSRREGHLGRFGVFGPSGKTPPASNHDKAAITKNGWFNFWALDPKPLDFRPVPCCDLRGGPGRKTNEQCPPRGPWRGYRGGFFSLILISLLEMRSTRFEARGLGGFRIEHIKQLPPTPHPGWHTRFL